MKINWKLQYGLIAIVVAIVIFVMSAGDAINFLKTPIKLETSDQVRALKAGDHVTFDIKMTFDCLISETQTTTKNGKVQDSKESARYYVIPFIEITESEVKEYDLTVKINAEDFDKVESGYDAFEKLYTEGVMPTEVIMSVDGLVKDMNDEEKKYVSSDYDAYMDKIYVNNQKKSTALITAGLGILFLLVGGILIVFFFLGRKKDKERLEELRTANPGYYEAPQNVSFNNSAAPQGAAFNLNNAPQNVTFNNGAAQPQADSLFNNAAQAPTQSGNFNEVSTSSNPQQYIDAAGNSTQFNEVSNNNNQQ